ncbi:MAG: NAD(P)-dependent dehydrogenase (short-subunit alcohol dehydrogenase family) [Verrucomicrobiales bacterium]|jgi:NAD(P)-dependent dehydrogenase (short-subunit alcohol dehydrogenase family)
MRLKDKALIVTGSSTGIGEAIARAAVAEGAKVLVHGIEADMTAAVANDLGMPYSVGDVSDPAHCTALVDAAVSAFGRLDGLVNNAGVSWRNLLEDTDAAFWDSVMAINVRAPMLIIRAALPHLSSSGGAVVNIGSVNGYCGEPSFVAYSASKGALMTLTRNLGDTLNREHGVRVNQINPGWVLSEGERRKKVEEGMDADWFEKLDPISAPSGRILKPAEIASTVVHFLSDDFGPISGQVIELEQYPMIGRNPPKC